MTDKDFTQEELDAVPTYVPESGDKYYVDVRFSFTKDQIQHDHGDEVFVDLNKISRTQAVGLDESDLESISESFAISRRMQEILSIDVGNIIGSGGSYEY